MRLSRRALLAAASALGMPVAAADGDGEDDVDPAALGAQPLGAQPLGGAPGDEPPSDCFIATAACGTAAHDNVVQLRRFRDDVLRQTAVGRAAIRLYYRTSPPVAEWIGRSPRRRRLVRACIVRPAAAVTNQLTNQTHD